VPVVHYVPVPHALTTPIAEPPPPPQSCTWAGAPAVCVSDALAWIERLRGKLEAANADRATLRQLDTQTIRGEP
jgi:hypothetical protein